MIFITVDQRIRFHQYVSHSNHIRNILSTNNKTHIASLQYIAIFQSSLKDEITLNSFSKNNHTFGVFIASLNMHQG